MRNLAVHPKDERNADLFKFLFANIHIIIELLSLLTFNNLNV